MLVGMKAPAPPLPAPIAINAEIVHAMRAAAEHPTTAGIKAIQALIWDAPSNDHAMPEALRELAVDLEYALEHLRSKSSTLVRMGSERTVELIRAALAEIRA
jgi:DNA-binding ferritin-like protein